MDDPWRYRIRGEFEAVPTQGGWRFGFHRLRSHSVLAIDTCSIHDLRIEHALPAFAQAANELSLTAPPTRLLPPERKGPALLCRFPSKGPHPKARPKRLPPRAHERLPNH